MNHRKRSRYVVGDLPFKTSEPVKTTVIPGSFTDSIPYKMSFVEDYAVKPAEFPPSIPATPISPPGSPFFIDKIDPPSIHYIETDALVVTSFSSTSLATSFSYTLKTSGDVDLMAVSSWVFDPGKNPYEYHFQHRGIRPDGKCYLIRYDDDGEGIHAHFKLPLDHKVTEEEFQAMFPYLVSEARNILRILFFRRKNVTEEN